MSQQGAYSRTNQPAPLALRRDKAAHWTDQDTNPGSPGDPAHHALLNHTEPIRATDECRVYGSDESAEDQDSAGGIQGAHDQRWWRQRPHRTGERDEFKLLTEGAVKERA